MKLSQINEATSPEQDRLNQEANDKRRKLLADMLRKTKNEFSSLAMGKIINNPKGAFRGLLKLATNDKIVAHDDSTSLQDIHIYLFELNPFLASVRAGAARAEWEKHVDDSITKNVAQFQKLPLESIDKLLAIIEEGILGTIGGIFTKIVKFLIKAAAAGLAIGASIASGGGRGGYGGYGRGGSSSTGSSKNTLTGEVEDKYKIQLRNAAFIDACIKDINSLAEDWLLNDADIINALSKAPKVP